MHGALALGKEGEGDQAGAQRRRKALQQETPGARLVAYLNCGMQEKDGASGGPVLSQTSGSYYGFACQMPELPVTQRIISFDGQALKFVLTDTNPASTYMLGLSWWDYDAAGRVQSLLASNRRTGRTRVLIDNAPLPSYTDRKLPPESRCVSLPADLVSGGGDIELTVRKDKGANAVLCEMWLLASP